MSKAGIPTVSLVFGNATAGGAYLPGMSDYTIMIRQQSKVFLGGPPLVKMATGEESDDESLGGAEMHARVSGLCDYLVADEHECLRRARDVIAHLGWRKLGPEPGPVVEPLEDPDDLLGIISADLKVPFDMREVLARVVDGSEFEEFKPGYGTALLCGWARVCGYLVGILANNQGVLFNEESEKAAQFIQLANQLHQPLIFAQNCTGYIVGRDYEQRGHREGRRQDGQRRGQLHGAAHHADGRSLLRRRQLRHVGSGLQPPAGVLLAECPHRGHGRARNWPACCRSSGGRRPPPPAGRSTRTTTRPRRRRSSTRSTGSPPPCTTRPASTTTG